VLPSAELAYETCLSAGSIAMALTRNGLPKTCKLGAQHGIIRYRELQSTEFARLPSECITENALRALKWSARVGCGLT